MWYLLTTGQVNEHEYGIFLRVFVQAGFNKFLLKDRGNKNNLINADKSESVIFIATTATSVIRILHQNTVLETSKK
jgi:hypothetical protein